MSETVAELRGAFVRGVVLRVDDTGPMQLVDVQTHDGMIRAGIEVYQPFGDAACVGEGAVVLLAAVGADPGDFVAFPAVMPSARFGRLAPGERVIHGADGSRVAIRQGGAIDIRAAASITLKVGDTTLTVSAEGVAISGKLDVSGDVTAGTISLENHIHYLGDGFTGVPKP